MKIKKVIFFLIMVVLVSVFGVAGLEIVTRTIDPLGVRYYYDVKPYFEIMQPDPDFAYRHTPEYRGTLQGVEYEINSEGFRWKEFDVEKPPCTVRVLVLGDSMVVGWGVQQENIFPARLQKLMDEAGRNVEVIPAGVGSWNTRTEYEFLVKRGLEYDPDIVVVLVESGDVEPKTQGKTLVKRENLFGTFNYAKQYDRSAGLNSRLSGPAKYSWAAMSLSHLLRLRFGDEWKIRLYDPDAPTWMDARDAMIGIVRACAKHKAAPVVFFWGLPEWSVYVSRCQESYGTVLDEMGVPNSTLPEKLYQREFYNSLVDTHPNAEGHSIIAKRIYSDIIDAVDVRAEVCGADEK